MVSHLKGYLMQCIVICPRTVAVRMIEAGPEYDQAMDDFGDFSGLVMRYRP